MSIEITPLHPVFAGEVAGIDTTRTLSRDAVAAIEAAMDRYAVLVFRGQRLTDDQQLAFSQCFGALEVTNGTGISKPGEQRLHPAFADVSNLDQDNQILARDNRRRLYSLGQYALALRQLVQAGAGDILDPVRPRRGDRGRRDRVRRHARRL